MRNVWRRVTDEPVNPKDSDCVNGVVIFSFGETPDVRGPRGVGVVPFPLTNAVAATGIWIPCACACAINTFNSAIRFPSVDAVVFVPVPAVDGVVVATGGVVDPPPPLPPVVCEPLVEETTVIV